MTSEDEIRGAAERQVDYFMQIVLKRYGVDEEEVPGLIDNLRWLNQHRKAATKITGGVTISVIGAVIVVTLMALWEGVKMKLREP